MPKPTTPCGPRSTRANPRRTRPMLKPAELSTDPSADSAVAQQSPNDFLTDFARQNPDLAWFAQLVAMQRQSAAHAQAEPPELEAARDEVVNLSERLRQSEVRADKLQRHVRRLTEE